MIDPLKVGYSEPYPCPRCGQDIRYQYGIDGVADAWRHTVISPTGWHPRKPYAVHAPHICEGANNVPPNHAE